MSYLYEKAPNPATGLRLHLNENTAGCSPAVLDAIRRLSATDMALYPDYTPAIEAAAARLGVPPAHLLLVNGLDEGILAASLAAVRSGGRADAEALIVVPAFDMQAACAEIAGARVIEVPLRDGFGFPADEVIAAVSAKTAIIFITTPNNPTGISVPLDDIFRIAAAAPAATVFVDEAYADFSGITLLADPRRAAHPNVLVGRTFAKAYGMAALRIGALVGAPETLAPIARVLPPYSVNVAAAAGLRAALADTGYYEWYLAQARASKALLYRTLDRLGIPYWNSDANFVLAKFGDDTPRVCAGLLEKGIYVRDRSKNHGCQGCVRITTGVVDHTRACVTALEEVLCGGR
jgi:histidinol-phosphate aminotransferase